MIELLPIIFILSWEFDLESHPNYPEYPVSSYHVQSVDCGSKYHGTTIPPLWQTWWNYFSVASSPESTLDPPQPSVVLEIPVQEWLRQFAAYPEYCHNDEGETHAGVYIWVAVSDNAVGEYPPFKGWWANLWGADVNRSGAIDTIDWLFFARCYANGDPEAVIAGNGGLTCAGADMNHSGIIDAPDSLLWSRSNIAAVTATLFNSCYSLGGPVTPQCAEFDENENGTWEEWDRLAFENYHKYVLQPDLVWPVPLETFERNCHPGLLPEPGCP